MNTVVVSSPSSIPLRICNMNPGEFAVVEDPDSAHNKAVLVCGYGEMAISLEDGSSWDWSNNQNTSSYAKIRLLPRGSGVIITVNKDAV